MTDEEIIKFLEMNKKRKAIMKKVVANISPITRKIATTKQWITKYKDKMKLNDSNYEVYKKKLEKVTNKLKELENEI
jgi:hypothetical protein